MLCEPNVTEHRPEGLYSAEQTIYEFEQAPEDRRQSSPQVARRQDKGTEQPLLWDWHNGSKSLA